MGFGRFEAFGESQNAENPVDGATGVRYTRRSVGGLVGWAFLSDGRLIGNTTGRNVQAIA